MTFFFYINFFLILFLNIWLILNYPSKFKKEKEKKYNRKKKHWLSSNRQRPQWKKKKLSGILENNFRPNKSVHEKYDYINLVLHACN
jgi:hypothetical protein